MNHSLSLKLTVGLLAFSMGAAAYAATAWTNTAGGNWEDAGNWNPNVVPTNQTVTINANGSYTVTVGSSAANTVPGSFTNVEIDIGTAGTGSRTLNYTYTNAINTSLTGSTGMNIQNSTVNWSAPNATLSIANFLILNSTSASTPGTLNVNAGNVTNVWPIIGSTAGSVGVINVNTGGTFTFTISDARFAEAPGAVAQFNINGGTFNWNNGSGLGYNAGSTGRVVMTSGTLTSSSGAEIGIGSYGANSSANGYGQFILSNGTLTANGFVNVGAGPGSVGDFQMYGGQFNANRGFTIGLGLNNTTTKGSATGTVLIAGGQMDYIGDSSAPAMNFRIGSESNSFGKLVMTGGTVNLNSILRNAVIGLRDYSSGEFDLAGGTFNVNPQAQGSASDNSFYIGVGSNSTAIMHVTGGRFTMFSSASTGLVVGSNDFAKSAQLILDGGRVELNFGKLTVGASGVLSNRTGGLLQFQNSDTVLGPSVDNRIVDGGTLSYKLYTALNVANAAAKFNIVSGSGLQLDTATNSNIAGTYILTNAAGNFKDLSLTGNGARWQSDSLLVDSSATLRATNAINARFASTVTNQGTIRSDFSTVTWERQLVNSGRYISDPSTNTYLSNVTVTASGTLEGGAGDLFDFKKNLIINSTNNTQFNLSLSTVRFSGGGNHTNEVTGGDFGTNGFPVADFMYGRLSLASTTDQVFFASGGFSNGSASNALYLRELELPGNNTNFVANLHSSFNIYYLLSSEDPFNTYLNDRTYGLSGGGLLTPFIPEPSSLALAAIASLLMVCRKRRAQP